jgi:hypothetical protein
VNYENFEKKTLWVKLFSKTKPKPKFCSYKNSKINLRKLLIAMLSTTKLDQKDGFILGANTRDKVVIKFNGATKGDPRRE